MSPQPTTTTTTTTAAAAVIYRRVSTGHQDNSLEVQHAALLYYRQANGFADAGEFCDEDTSGSIPFADRPGGADLLRRLALGGVTHLLAAKQDRLGRDTVDVVTTIRALWQAGVTPHFITEGGALPRNPQNELLMGIKAGTAQYERDLIRGRTRDTLRHMAARNQITGTIPYGWTGRYTFHDGHQHHCAVALTAATIAPFIAAHGPCTAKELIDHPAEQAWIRQIAAWRGWQGLDRPLAPGHSSLHAIAQWLNQKGVPTKSGGQWQTGTVDNLFHARRAQELMTTPTQPPQP